jgi:hypothetical protein
MECNCQLDCTSENAKATAANRSLFLKPTGLVIKTCNLVMSVVKNETVSTAHGSECYPCAGCHAMYECCPQFFGLLLGELSRESIQHFDTPHLRIFPNPNVVKACKLAFWLCGVASIPRHEKFCLANIPLAFVLTSFWNPCTEKNCFTSVPCLWVGGCIRGIDLQQSGLFQAVCWPSMEVDQQRQ